MQTNRVPIAPNKGAHKTVKKTHQATVNSASSKKLADIKKGVRILDGLKRTLSFSPDF